MHTALESLRSELDTMLSTDNLKNEADQYLLATGIGKEVENFLANNNLAVNKGGDEDAAFEAVESLGDQVVGMGSSSIVELLDACGIHKSYQKEAAEAVVNVFAKHAKTTNPSRLWSNQVAGMESIDASFKSAELSDIYGNDLMSFLDTEDIAYSAESFGIDMDRATPDIKMDIAIAIMRFHADLTAMIIPIRPTSEPCVRYTRQNAEIYTLGDRTAPVKQLVDLYEDPSMVDTDLKDIKPAAAADPSNNFTVPLAGGELIYQFDKEVNVLDLSVDPAKPGYTKVNRTDLVSDNVKVKAIYVNLTDGTNTNKYRIEIPEAYARLTRNANNLDVAERSANFTFETLLTKNTETTDPTQTLFPAACAGDEGIMIKLLISSKINLKTGASWTTCGISLSEFAASGTPTTDLDTLFGNITDPVKLGYELDAKFSEENMRKSNVAIKTSRQSFSYEIKAGRNYVIDYSLAQNNAQSNATILTKVIRIGQGRRTLKTIIEVINRVAQMTADRNAGIAPESADPGKYYVAGSRCRPYVISDTLDLHGITTITDSGRSGDIKERALMFLNSVISDLETNSFYNQQLAPGVLPHYTLVTTNNILDNVLAQKHTHDHLDNSAEPNTGIEYRLVAPCGAIVDVKTTTDTMLGNRMIMYPTLPDSKESELNFGHNWDYGTMVGHYSLNDGARAANNRIFGNTRELVIPTNPVAAIIDVVNVEEAVFRG